MYEKGQIYGLYDNEGICIYVGSTVQPLHKRYWMHKTDCKRKPDQPIYKYINENGGIEHFKIVLIEDYPCENKKQLNRKEGEHIRLINPLGNRRIAGRTAKEYFQENKEKEAERKRLWREANKEKEAERTRIWYQANKEKVAEWMRQYRQENKEQLAEQRRLYYEANKEKVLERHRLYDQKNKDKIAERQRLYRENNKEKVAERKRLYRENNKEKIAERKRLKYHLRKKETTSS